MLGFEGGPWHGERRRFPEPAPKDVLVKAGGEYRLETGYTGWRYVWYPDRLDEEPERAI